MDVLIHEAPLRNSDGTGVPSATGGSAGTAAAGAASAVPRTERREGSLLADYVRFVLDGEGR